MLAEENLPLSESAVGGINNFHLSGSYLLQSIPGASEVLIGLLISWLRTNLFACECSWPLPHKRDHVVKEDFPAPRICSAGSILYPFVLKTSDIWALGKVATQEVICWASVSSWSQGSSTIQCLCDPGPRAGSGKFSPKLNHKSRFHVWIGTQDCCEFGLSLNGSIRDPTFACL